MPCSLSGVKPLPRPLPTPSEFYLPETQPPELPRQPSSDSPTGSTQPWSDSPAVPQPPSSPHSPPSIADTREGLVPKRRLGIADEDAPHSFVGRARLDFFVGRGPWTKVRWGE
ncbi:unnamed protein product [Dicrocoelium dendriticum]|nr:unnamed protein product [Dicrocoelium dendriticum]